MFVYVYDEKGVNCDFYVENSLTIESSFPPFEANTAIFGKTDNLIAFNIKYTSESLYKIVNSVFTISTQKIRKDFLDIDFDCRVGGYILCI